MKRTYVSIYAAFKKKKLGKGHKGNKKVDQKTLYTFAEILSDIWRKMREKHGIFRLSKQILIFFDILYNPILW